jgi:DsbC/DsbD-like thiol-disulfide interchange protein/cytochrome c biogenesis protein CcdA
MKHIAHFLLTLSLLLGGACAAIAEENAPIAQAELLVDAAGGVTGEPIAAGVTFTMPEGWHIYWKNPGDSGLETRLEWTLPEGLRAGEIEWPAPEAIEIGGLVNYGYSRSVTLPVALLPTRADISGTVTVKANWLVCKEICIPESADLSAPFAANPEAGARIAAARAQVPTVDASVQASYHANEKHVRLTVTLPPGLATVKEARFYPLNDGILANYPQGKATIDIPRITFTHSRGTADVLPALEGVITLTYPDGTKQHRHIAAQLDTQPASLTSSLNSAFLYALLLAFLGGLVLNIMPCVLPILALKALALSKKASASRAAAARQGIHYTLGVVVSFLGIAALMIALKTTGNAVGWGFQLQDPFFVGFLALVMVLVAANLLGLFSLPVLFGNRASAVDETKSGGSFLTGVLAVLVATPCTAPFMATAIGATLAMPALLALAVFAALGLGMAAPFLLISLWPAARRLIPKPGPWMVRFKHFLAIPMLATALWLGWVLMQILSPNPVMDKQGWVPYSATRLEALRAEGTPVLVDATAAWCITCKVNARIAIEPADMQQFFREQNVTLMLADWTKSDPEITAYLAQYGRNGVPLVVYYPPNGKPVILPQVLSKSALKEAILAR